MSALSGLLPIALAALAGAAQSIPPELDALVARARLEGPVTSWCRGEFRAGHPGAYAVAIASGLGGGRYVVLNGDGTIATLAAFTAGTDLACYSADEARALEVRCDHLARCGLPAVELLEVPVALRIVVPRIDDYSALEGLGWERSELAEGNRNERHLAKARRLLDCRRLGVLA